MTPRTYNELDVRLALKRRCGDEWDHSASVFARKYGLELNHVLNVIEGNASPSVVLLDALGFARVTRYVRVEKTRGRPS